MDSEILLFGVANLVAGLIALAVAHVYYAPATRADQATPALYEVVERKPMPADGFFQ